MPRTLITALILAFTLPAPAQNILVVMNKNFKGNLDGFFNNAPRWYIIEEGETIGYVFKDSKKEKLKKKKIDNILYPFYIIMEDKPYTISKFEYITFHDKTRLIKRITGPVILTAGAAIAGSGAFIGNYAITGLTEASSFVFAVTPITMAAATFGIGVIILGADVMVKGVRLIYFGLRRPKIYPGDDKNWECKVVEKTKLGELKVKPEKPPKTKVKRGNSPTDPYQPVEQR